MRIAVVVFPGTNCEHDVVHALGRLGAEAELVWHREVDLAGFDGAILPGGFAHGDYLRTGAIARISPVMRGVADLAAAGRPVLGICNGFQILCEAGLLPGALIANRDLRFICAPVHVVVEHADSMLTRLAVPGDVLDIPLNSYEGNYVASSAALDALEAAGGVALRYCDAAGRVGPESNPNGSSRSIAAVAVGSVAGIMPHPERAVEEVLGSTGGMALLESFLSEAMSRV